MIEPQCKTSTSGILVISFQDYYSDDVDLIITKFSLRCYVSSNRIQEVKFLAY